MESQENEWSDFDDEFLDQEAEGRCNFVPGFTPKIEDDILELYFENSRWSGDGKIESASTDRADGSVIITYRDPNGEYCTHQIN